MRHVTRRRHRMRRARLTRKRKQKQRGGALGDTEALTMWLHKVFTHYTTFGQADNSDRPFNTKTGAGVELGAIIAKPEDSDAIAFDKDEDVNYTLPLNIQPGVVMPSDNEIDSYDLKGNFGHIVRIQVLELSSAQEGQSVSQMSTMRFSSSVDYMMTEPGLYPVEQLLKTENILRGLLRADLTSEEISQYRHIAEDITSLSDVNTYPLYVWAVALTIDAQGSSATDQRLIPLLSHESTQEEPAQKVE